MEAKSCLATTTSPYFGGALLTILVGVALMGLMFYSRRQGFDEPPRWEMGSRAVATTMAESLDALCCVDQLAFTVTALNPSLRQYRKRKSRGYR